MKPQADLVAEFKEGAVTGKASNMFIDGDVIYSYRRGFPLAVRGQFGAPLAIRGALDVGIKFLINGDKYSRSTSQQQGTCIQRLTPNVQIPFSALEPAGLISYPYRYTHPTVAVNFDLVSFTKDETRYLCKTCNREVEYFHTPEFESGYRHSQDQTLVCNPHSEGVDPFRYEHVLGAVVLKDRNNIHWLSSRDQQEAWGQSYFLCELPQAVQSVLEAFTSLKPEYVAQAEQAGFTVKRQGDVYLIPSEQPTRSIHALTEKDAPLIFTPEGAPGTHYATQVRRNGKVWARGKVYHNPGPYRRPQHKALFLKQTWHESIKNLAGRSFSAVGDVD